MFYVFLALAAFALSVGLRSYFSPVARKIGSIGFLAGGGLLVYGLFDSLVLAFAVPILWIILLKPWLAILTQVKGLRLPLNKTLHYKSPPSEEDFPALEELSVEVERENFSFLRDSGWSWGEFTQLFRLFVNESHHMEARICVNQMGGFIDYYVTLATRRTDGTLWMTTNDPWTTPNDMFSLGMAANPRWRIQRMVNARSFKELFDSHRRYLAANGVSGGDIVALEPEDITDAIEDDLKRQLGYNLQLGLLAKVTETEVRYTWKGMLFLWGQSVRDLVRLN